MEFVTDIFHLVQGIDCHIHRQGSIAVVFTTGGQVQLATLTQHTVCL